MATSLSLIYEVRDLQDEIAETQKEFKSKCDPPPWLEDAESAFKWSASLVHIETMLFHIPDKLEQYKNQGSDYGFEKISFLLPLIVQYSISPYKTIEHEEESNAESNSVPKDENIRKLEYFINVERNFQSSIAGKAESDINLKYEPDNGSIINSYIHNQVKTFLKPKETLVEEMVPAEEDSLSARVGPALPHIVLAKRAERANKPIIIDRDMFDPEKNLLKCKEAMKEMDEANDTLYIRIGPALQHVVHATWAHMLYLKGDIAESKKIARNIQPVNEMSTHCRAGIKGLKSKFLLSHYRDLRVALNTCMEAIHLDSEFGYWQYLAGKIIRKIRRDFKEGEITIQEVDHFKEAVEYERNPKFLVYLGQAHQEMAQLFSRKRNLGVSMKTVNEMLRQAVDLYRECWSLKKDSIPICRRLGAGLSKMNSYHIDIEVAREALLKALELAPDGKINHCLGKFYYIHEKDDEKALECFEKLHTDYAHGEIIRLNLIRDLNYDPVDIIKEWEDYHSVCNVVASKQEYVFADIGWYYLFFKKDLYASVKNFWKILMKDPKSYRVMEYSSYPFCVNKDKPLNMIDVLCNEIKVAKEKNEVFTAQEMNFLEGFVEKMELTHPELHEMKLRPDLMKDIRNDVWRDINILREKRYGNCKFEGFHTWQSSARPKSNPENMQETRMDFTRKMEERSGMHKIHDRFNRDEAHRKNRNDLNNKRPVNRKNWDGMSYNGGNGGENYGHYKFEGGPTWQNSTKSNPEDMQGTRMEFTGKLEERSGMNKIHGSMRERFNREEVHRNNNAYNMNNRCDLRNNDQYNKHSVNRKNFDDMSYNGGRGGGRKSYYNSSRYDVSTSHENWRKENKTMSKENC